MDWSFTFLFNNILLGIGLAMDAFSVSLVNGLSEPCMKRKKIFLIAFVFAAFQAIMPLIGWFCVHTIVDKFAVFKAYIPWVAFILLIYIGGGMIKDGVKNDGQREECLHALGFLALIIQGVATSIDALSVGFTIAEYNWVLAIVSALIIAIVTYFICNAGVVIGKRFGTKLSGKSLVLGGIILVFIGIEILIKGII